MEGSIAAALPQSDRNVFPEDREQDPEDSTATEAVANQTQPSETIAESVKHSVTIDKPLVQLRVKPPEGFQRNKAALVVDIKPTESLNIEPQEALTIVGKEIGERTIFLKEEGAAIKIYVRSLPAAPWTIQFAARLRITASLEIPLEESVVNRSLDQLAAMQSHWNQQLSLLQQVRQHPRAIKQNIDILENQIESTQQEITDLIDVLRDGLGLVQAFESFKTVDVYTAADASKLPSVEIVDVDTIEK